MLMVQLIL